MNSTAGFQRPLALLISAQALAGSSMTMLVTVSGLVGLALAPEQWLTTVPMSAMTLGILLGILPWSWVIQHLGYRPALLGGLGIGLVGVLLAALSLGLQSFSLYTLSCLLIGGMSASVQFYVYAATELVQSAAIRRHIIAAVTTAGLISAFLGPSLVRLSPALLASIQFAGGFIALAGIICLAALAIYLVPLPGPSAAVARSGSGRSGSVSWSVLRAGPLYGMLISAAGFAMMTMLMVGAPMAMKHHGHGSAVAAGAIQWHFVAMYAPALVAGAIMNRLGGSLTATIGVGVAAIAVWIAQYAHSPIAYTGVLVCCGVGWSFMHTSGTAMVVERCSPNNKARVQGLANLVVSSTSMVGSFSAGPLLIAVGYPGLAVATLIPLTAAVLALLAGRTVERVATPSVSAQS